MKQSGLLLVCGALMGGCSGDDGATSTSVGSTSDGTSSGSDSTVSSTSSTSGSSTGSATTSSETTGETTSSSGGSTSGTTAETTGESSSSGGTTGGEACNALFLNFDGVTLTPGLGPDDATMDTASFATELGGPLAAYTGSVAVDDVANKVAEHMAPFNVCVTTTRPADGEYTMVVVTDTDPFLPSILSIASLDCGNTNPNNVAVVFFNDAWGVDVDAITNVTSASYGQGIGLEFVSSPVEEMMCSGACADPPNPPRSFTDMCQPLMTNGGGECGAEHEVNCPAGQQNSFQEMLTALGQAG